MIAIYVSPKKGFFKTVKASGIKKFVGPKCKLMQTWNGEALIPGSHYFKTGHEKIYKSEEILNDPKMSDELKQIIIHNIDMFTR
tara:strand:+ start:832 stop:1083 length:252 start_codon:yes stop_codon:yes gene_type:complete